MEDTPAPRLTQDQLVGRNVQKFRKARRLTQEQLAERLLRNQGVPLRQQVLAKVEQGSRPLRLNEAAAIARELEVSVDALLAGRTADTARIVIEGIEEIRSLCDHIDRLGQMLLDTQELLKSEIYDPRPFEEPAAISEQMLYEASRAIHARPQALPEPSSDIDPEAGGPVGLNEHGPF